MNDIAGEVFDLAVIGGGINGCGVARDAAGRGLKVFLCEAADLGGGTSAASSKLIHGGLRYLEQRQFRLVRESLAERKILRDSAPHLVTPLRFVLPHHPKMRAKWLIFAGLWLYDRLAGARNLAPSSRIKLHTYHKDTSLREEFTSGFEYTDCRTDDARLVIAVAQDARRLGARIVPQTRCDGIAESNGMWRISLRRADGTTAPMVRAKAVVNAGVVGG